MYPATLAVKSGGHNHPLLINENVQSLDDLRRQINSDVGRRWLPVNWGFDVEGVIVPQRIEDVYSIKPIIVLNANVELKSLPTGKPARAKKVKCNGTTRSSAFGLEKEMYFGMQEKRTKQELATIVSLMRVSLIQSGQESDISQVCSRLREHGLVISFNKKGAGRIVRPERDSDMNELAIADLAFLCKRGNIVDEDGELYTEGTLRVRQRKLLANLDDKVDDVRKYEVNASIAPLVLSLLQPKPRPKRGISRSRSSQPSNNSVNHSTNDEVNDGNSSGSDDEFGWGNCGNDDEVGGGNSGNDDEVGGGNSGSANDNRNGSKRKASGSNRTATARKKGSMVVESMQYEKENHPIMHLPDTSNTIKGATRVNFSDDNTPQMLVSINHPTHGSFEFYRPSHVKAGEKALAFILIVPQNIHPCQEWTVPVRMKKGEATRIIVACPPGKSPGDVIIVIAPEEYIPKNYFVSA